ncbi:MAG: hypothetical protein IJY61_01345 [Candidatus Gastranaerophilales bacterium]|nr:hypothetical protein [Candidatus Gastranaerophilales bacterium]
MNVSFSPVNYNRNYTFKAANTSKSEVSVAPTKREVMDAKTRKSISECFCVVLGVVGLYMYGKVSGKKFLNMLQAKKKSEQAKAAKELIEPILPTKKTIDDCRRLKYQSKL